MKKITYPLKPVQVPSEYLKLLQENDCFLDIETTGLSRDRNHIYLIGLGFYHAEEHAIEVVQYFSENVDQEEDLLRSFLSEWNEEYRIVTYNGNRFDLPFLDARIARLHPHHGIESSEHVKNLRDILSMDALAEGFSNSVRLDLLLTYKPLKNLLNLPSLKQTMVESFLRVHRDDQYNGKELISVYHRYEKTQSPTDLELLLLHNQEDVEGMIELFYMEAYRNLPEKILEGHFESDTTSTTVTFQGRLSTTLPAPLRYQEEDFYLILESDAYRGAFLPKYGKIRYVLSNPEEYVYLISENKVIPKSIAGVLDKTTYRKARPEEAFMEMDIRNFKDSDIQKIRGRLPDL